MSRVDFAKIRNDFPMLSKTMHGKPLIYFDTANTSQKPQIVIDTITNYYQNQYGNVHRAVYELSVYATQAYEASRQKVKAFINAANASEIVFTRGTTDSINIVANSFGKAFVKSGDEIIISEMEHHSNIVPWQILCEERGAVLKVIPMSDSAELSLETYQKMLNEKTRIVALGHVSNATGTVNPIKKMIKMAHEHGAKVLIDGAQSAPHLPVDVQDLDADFFVFSGHKLYGPTGIGILYGKEALLNVMPPRDGGGDMIETVTFPKTTYNKLPLKFEAGTPLIAEVIGLGTAIDYLNNIGLQNIHQWENELLEHATASLEGIPGLRIIGKAPEKGAIISFAVEGIHALDIGTMLDLRGIAIRTGHLCAQPVLRHFSLPALCRASFAFYNTKQEIDFFAKSLVDIINLLKN